MDWGLVSIPLAIILFIVTIVLTLKIIKRKKPVWAYKTTRIIGVGSDAPPEISLTFGGIPVSDVYETKFIFFNRGTETIRKEDVTDNVTIHFKGATILRPPSVKAKSKEATRFSARQVVKQGNNAIELGFKYLDHDDGAVVVVIHSASEQVSCSGNIIGARKIANIGVFETSRSMFLGIRLIVTTIFMALLFGIVVSGWRLLYEQFTAIPVLIILALVGAAATYIPEWRVYLRHRQFPDWSIIKE